MASRFEKHNDKGKQYKYGSKRRGFQFDGQPSDGLLSAIESGVLEDENEDFYGYHVILFYDRELTEAEMKKYNLERIND